MACLAGEEVPKFVIPGDILAAALSSDEQLLFVAKHHYSKMGGHEVCLGAHRLDDVHRVVAEIRFPSVWDDQAALAISPDGRQVTLASGDVRLRIYGMPDLKLIREYHFPCRETRSARICQMAYSPDGRWLVVTQKYRTTPRLFDAATAQEKMLDEGHGDRIVDLRFSADGRTLRSVGNDGTVCTWDATTMKMLRRISLPADRPVGHIRPSDGRYVLCPVATDPTGSVRVVDLDTGTACCEVALPLAWHGSEASRQGAATLRHVYWLSDQEALCTGYFIKSNIGVTGYHWWRFNCQTGKVLSEGRLDLGEQNALCNGRGLVTEDGNHLFYVDGGGKGSPPTAAGRVNLRTFRSAELGRIDRPINGRFGLVPGGKYSHLGLHVYDRRTLNLVAAREFPHDKARVGLVTFSLDGSRCAAALYSNAKPEAVVVVYETLTNRVLLAFTSAMTVAHFRLSQNGTRLALAYNDGTLEVRSVPSGRPERLVGRVGAR